MFSQQFSFFFQLKPVIDKEFGFEEMPAAYAAVGGGSLRGKVVVGMEK